jgi:diguanylate cyclase (GGDEF)-like protein/PAS domain S-box-containing protein
MDSSNTVYFLIATGLSIICLSIIIYSIKHRTIPGAIALAIMMSAILTYSIPYFFQLSSESLRTATIWYNISLPGANFIAPAWILFAAPWSGLANRQSKQKTTALTILLFVIPILVSIAAWTNPIHGLYGANFLYDVFSSPHTLIFSYGLIFWIGVIYAYFLTVAGILIFLSVIVQKLKIFYTQSILILLGMSIPIIINLSYYQGNSPINNIDLAPFSFVFTGIIWGIAIFFFRFLKIIPIPYRSVFTHMPVGMIVLDKDNRVADINRSAADLVKVHPLKVLGHHLPEDIVNRIAFVNHCKEKNESTQVIELSVNGEIKYVEVRQTPFYDRNSLYIGILLVLTDKTSQYLIEKALSESESSLLRAQAVAKVGNWEIDLCNQNVQASDEAYRIYGLERTSEFLPLKDIQQIPLADERKRLDNALDGLIQFNKPYDIEFKINRKSDNQIRVIHTVASVIFDENHKPVKVVGVIQDITERKLAEEALQLSELQFRSFFEQAAVGVVVTDAKTGELLKVNQRFGDILGYKPEEFQGMHFSELTHPDDVKVSLENMDSLLSGNVHEFSVEKRYRRKFGDYIWTSITAAAMWQPGEEPTSYIAIVQDLSERKSTEIALQQNEIRFKELVENLGEGIAIVDENETFTFANPASHRIFGVPQQSLIGRNLKEFLDPENQKFIEDQTEDRRHGKTNIYEIEIIRSRGDKRIIQISSRPQKDEQGNFQGSFGIFRDISEQKRSEQVQRVIYKIAQAMISAIGIGELYTSIHTILKELLPVDNFYIALYDKNTNLISYPYVVDQYDDPPEPKVPGRGLTEYVLRSGKPILVTPEVFDLLVAQGEVEPLGSDSIDWMGSPLIVDGQIIGVMVMQSYTESLRFNHEDLHLLEFVSNQVALAIARKHIEETQQHQSTHDNLTGLYNRQYYELEISRLQHSRQFPISMLMMDVDKLKRINDAYGHSAGDEYLRRVASILKTAFRPEDMVARIGGDEFIAILPETNADSAKLVVNRLLHSFDKHNLDYPADQAIEISIGTACGDENCLLTDVYKQADKAMYVVKAEKSLSLRPNTPTRTNY